MLFLNWRDTTHPEGGGSELYVERTAAGLRSLGHEVTIACSAHRGAPREEVRPDGVRLVRRGGRLGVYLQAARAYRRGELGRPDVIVEVHNGVPFLARLWARGRPVVVVVHHVHREQWRVVFGPVRARIGWWLESRVAPRVNRHCRYVTVSEATRAELARLGVPREGITVIHNGTDLPPAEPVERAAYPALLALGRLVPHKRVEIALETAAALRREFPELRLTVAGSGWWEEQLRRRARELGLDGHVEFTGHVDDDTRHRLYARSWVSLVPSLKEGWGLVVVEAGVCGTPSVAFHGAGGLEESVIDGVTGSLVPEGDVPAFVAATRALLLDGGLRARLGAEAATHARAFSWDETVKAFDEVLQDVAGRRPR